MKLEPGDLVEIVALPSHVDGIGALEREVYVTCLGFKLAVERVEADGMYVFQLHQEWDHFPAVAPFDLRFDPDCLRKIEPFADAEWATLSEWMGSDASIAGEVIEVEGQLKARLEGKILGDVALPDGASQSDYLGKTLPVRIIMLNRKKRDLVVYPSSP